jgi:RNA polymerase sigma-70 factor (ECF subfamily)
MTSALTDENSIPLLLVASEDASKQSGLTLSTLTTLMRDGRDEAWAEFHWRYYLMLLRYAAARATCPDDADEIVQQAYLRIARHIKPFTDETQFCRWLACVVRCAAVDHQRGITRRVVLLEKFAHWQDLQRTSIVALPGGPADSLAHEALAKLPAEDAQLLRLKYCEGWSVDQLAADAHTTPKTIENRLARLRRRLREIILRIQ